MIEKEGQGEAFPLKMLSKLFKLLNYFIQSNFQLDFRLMIVLISYVENVTCVGREMTIKEYFGRRSYAI